MYCTRSVCVGRAIIGCIIGSLLLCNALVIGYSPFPIIKNASAQVPYVAPQMAQLSHLSNPLSPDFMSVALALVPHPPGADLSMSNFQGVTHCDLRTPITYVDGGCMTSLPLLFPFTAKTYAGSLSSNQTAFTNVSGTTLSLSIGLASTNITAGQDQTVTLTVFNASSNQNVEGAEITANVTDVSGFTITNYTGITDITGQDSFTFTVPADSQSGTFGVSAQANANGYEPTFEYTTFEVIGSEFSDFFDNSTSDDFSSDDSCCSSSDSSSSDNSDFTSPTVKSTDPGDGDNNVPTDLSEIKVTFDESIDKNSVDTGSLSIFVNSGIGNTPDVDSVSVSGKTATFKISPSIGSNTLSPDVSYIASISTNIEDKDGNFLDCFDSKGVDDNCEWEFSTSGSSGSAAISLSPTSGPVGTSVDITGTGFVPNVPVAITFDDIAITGTVTTDGNGKFSDTFNVPFAASIGLDTVRANSASTTFTVTTSTTPIIVLDPTSGPAGISVTVAGINFDPNSDVTIKFGTNGVTTNPSPLKTTSTGTFIGTFNVPISSSVGDNTVTATQGSNVASRTFKVTASTVPVITLNVTSGPTGTPVAVTGIGFAPTTDVTIKFGDTTVSNPVTPNNNGGFSASFIVPSSLSGPKTVTATQGSNSASKPFTVTPSTIPTISLNPTFGPNDASVNVIGSGFDPNAAATINFDGNPVDTIPPTVIANSIGEFSATFKVPELSSLGDHPVVVSQADNSASTTFKVTSTSSSSFAATTRSNISSFEAPANQSKATLVPPPSNQSNASVPVATNTSSNTADSNSKVTFENNTRPTNMSPSQRADKTSTSPTDNKINNTSINDSTDNKINEDHVSSASSQSNDTSNIKKSSETSISTSHAKSKNQLTSAKLTNDNTDDENQSSVTVDKTITKVKSPNSDNQPEKQSRSIDSIKKDRALFFKYLNSKNNVNEVDKTEVNNRPVAIDDKATTDAKVPVDINILRNDKDSDGDKLSIMGMSPPVKGKIESDSDGTITYTPLESWSGTERFGYTISDGRGGVATASVVVIVQPAKVENQPPEAQDQDVTINGNNPVKIKLDAKDPDDGKLRFVLVSKPSHGRIVQFSSSTGTLAYVPDDNYDGKDDFAFKVYDGTGFSKDAKVSIKIENNEKSSNDQAQGNDPQQKKDESSQTPSEEQKSNDEKSNSDNPPNDSSQQSSPSTLDTEQQKKDQKQEEQQSSPAEKHTSDGDSAPSGDSQSTSDS